MMSRSRLHGTSLVFQSRRLWAETDCWKVGQLKLGEMLVLFTVEGEYCALEG